jgi:hypothetical protein
MEELEQSRVLLQQQAEALYTSLNITESFPELQGVDLEFVKVLLMARDLKIVIRKRAIGSFFEEDKLKQAVGGRHQPLGMMLNGVCNYISHRCVLVGTKLQQQTKKAISKRKPALMAAIRKFNNYCERLATLHQPHRPIPLPQQLPTDPFELRKGSHALMEDVWFAPISGQTPRWLDDANVRQGIRAMLKLDRCLEERRRLGNEADNLCRWFGRELCALELALRTHTSESSKALFLQLVPQKKKIKDHLIMLPLQRRKEKLLALKERWVNSLASDVRFEFHVREALTVAQHISGQLSHHSFNWVEQSPIPEVDDDELLEHSSVSEILDTDQIIASDVLISEDDSREEEHEFGESLCTDNPIVNVVWSIPVFSFLMIKSFL